MDLFLEKIPEFHEDLDGAEEHVNIRIKVSKDFLGKIENSAFIGLLLCKGVIESLQFVKEIWHKGHY